MKKYSKCPKGVICFENFAIVILFIVIFSIGYLLYNIQQPMRAQTQPQPQPMQPQQINVNYESGSSQLIPPYRNDGYLVPVNISTNVGAVNSNFSQLGILTPVSQTSKDNILPLMGRPLFTSRSKFQYYTISNQNNQIKLPITINGRSGLDEIGVDELFDGDTVYIEGYEDVFKVTKYDNGTIRY